VSAGWRVLSLLFAFTKAQNDQGNSKNAKYCKERVNDRTRSLVKGIIPEARIR